MINKQGHHDYGNYVINLKRGYSLQDPHGNIVGDCQTWITNFFAFDTLFIILSKKYVECFSPRGPSMMSCTIL